MSDEPDEPLQRFFTIVGDDDELDAMRIIAALLAEMHPAARHRALKWARGRFAPPKSDGGGETT